MKIVKSIVFGLVILIGAFAYFAPASIIQIFLPANTSTAGISGTLWKGNLRTIVIDKIGIQNTKWNASPFSLLTGKVKADVSINSNNLQGQFQATYSGSAVHTKDLDLIGDLSLLLPYFEQYGLTISGQFEANFINLDIENGIPKHADGVLQLFDTSILGIIPLNLGDVTSTFEETTDGLKINLDNTNGELDLNGVITINTKGVYLANLMLSRNSQTPDQVLQTVQLIGNKISEDSVKLVHSGQLRI